VANKGDGTADSGDLREYDPRKRRGPENKELLRRWFNPISVIAQNAASSPLAGEKCAGENRKL
jgi:hypothetical protein